MRGFAVVFFVILAAVTMACLAAGPATKPAGFAAFRDGGGLSGQAQSLPLPARPDAQFRLSLRWTYQTDPQQHPSVESAATISGDTVYVADERGTLHAID